MDPWLEQFEARRKERETADRTFTLLGETLTVKPSVAPEIGLRIARFQMQMAEHVDAVNAAEKTGTEPPSRSGISTEEMLDLSESVIRSCITADSLEAWERLRASDAADPLNLMDIYSLAIYALSRASGVPTEGSSDSSDGPANTNGKSKGRSSSTAGARKR